LLRKSCRRLLYSLLSYSKSINAIIVCIIITKNEIEKIGKKG
jgi:hypothetical protein